MAASQDFPAHPLRPAAAAAVLLGTLAVTSPVEAATAPQEILVSRGTVVTSEERFAADVRVRDGTIVEIGTGLLVMPGGVDPHVHLGGRLRDDYRTASQAALAGGITTISNFAFPSGGRTLAQAIELTAAGRTSLEYFPDSRPVVGEVVATQRAVAMSEATRAPIYAVHVSSEGALRVLQDARDRGLSVFVETRPIYLHFTRERFEGPDRGLYVAGSGELLRRGRWRAP